MKLSFQRKEQVNKMRLDDVLNELLEIPSGSQVFIRKARLNPKYTHTIVLMNEDNVMIKRVLYDERTLEIFKDNDRNQQAKTTFNWNKVETESLLTLHRDEMIRMVNSGLRWAINDHGAITKNNITSAAKRVTTLLYNFLGVRVSFEKDGRSSEYSDTHLYLNEIHLKDELEMSKKVSYHSKDKIKKLHELTGLSLLKCKKALAEANSEFETAREMLLLKTEK
jgi:hypothetical protein